MKKSFSLALLLWLVIADLAMAEDYELILGKGVELCEVCLKNLRRQSVEEAVCDRKYAANLGLSAPEWTPLDLREHVNFYKRVSNLVERGNEFAKNRNFDDPKNFEAFFPGALKRDSMEITVVDIDNDAKPDELLRFRSGNCKNMFSGFQHFYESALLVLTDNRRAIDLTASGLLAQHLFVSPTQPVGIPHFQIYQVFSYKGRTYFDKWDGGGGIKGRQEGVRTISLYRTMKGQTEKVCQFRFSGN